MQGMTTMLAHGQAHLATQSHVSLALSQTWAQRRVSCCPRYGDRVCAAMRPRHLR